MVKKGFYRHFKGHIYYVLGVGCLKHEGDRRVVVYTSVKTEEQDEYDFLLRDEEDFAKWIRGDEGAREEVDPPKPLSEQLEKLLDDGFEARFDRITDPERSRVP